MYIPEQDNGRSIDGRFVRSGNMWIPKERIPNVDSFLSATTIVTNDFRTKTTVRVALAYETEHHVVCARHFFTDTEWREMFGAFETITPETQVVDFKSKFSPRDERQAAAWANLSKAPNGVLNLGCGAGKTTLSLHKIAQNAAPALVVVNSEDLLEQWKDRIGEFLGISASDVGVVRGPKEAWDKHIVLAMIHTLANRVEDNSIDMEVRQRFGTIVFDEVHHLAAQKFSLVAPIFLGNRFGLSATPDRTDGLEGVYYAHTGAVFYSDLCGDLSADIYFYLLDTKPPENFAKVFLDYKRNLVVANLYKYLAGLTNRNISIINAVSNALKAGRKILVLTHLKAHAELLQEMLLGRSDLTKYTSCVVTSDTKDDHLHMLRNTDVAFATIQLANEGLDISSLDTLIYATPFKSWNILQQGKGRTERRHKKKMKPLVIVFEDKDIAPAMGMCKGLKRGIRENGFTYKEVK